MWELPEEGKIGLIKKKNSNTVTKTVLALVHPYLNFPISVTVKEEFVPSQQRYVVTMQNWERSNPNGDGHFVLRNIDKSALEFNAK